MIPTYLLCLKYLLSVSMQIFERWLSIMVVRYSQTLIGPPDFAEGSSTSASRLQLYEKIGSNRGEFCKIFKKTYFYNICKPVLLDKCSLWIPFRGYNYIITSRDFRLPSPYSGWAFSRILRDGGSKSPPSLKSVTHILQTWNFAQSYLT